MLYKRDLNLFLNNVISCQTFYNYRVKEGGKFFKLKLLVAKIWICFNFIKLNLNILQLKLLNYALTGLW